MADDLVVDAGAIGNVDNEGMADDFLSSHQLIDDDGNPLHTEDPTDTAEKPKPTDTQKSASKSEETEQESEGDEKSPEFADQFFSAAEDGTTKFDAKGALAFLTKEQEGKQTEGPVNYREEEKKTDQETNPYRARVIARKEYQDGLLTERMMWKNEYGKLIKEGIDPSEAIRLADQHCRDSIADRLADWEHEYDLKQADSKKGLYTDQERAAHAAITKANMASFVNHLGGEDKVQSFFFGTGQGKQYKPGFASDAMFWAYRLTNPDNPEPTQQEYSQWWNKFGSDMRNLQMLFELGLAKMQRHLLPQIVKAARATKDETEKQKSMAQQRTPSSLKKASPTQMDKDLATFLAPPDQREMVNSV